jgi:ferrochelatase
LALGPYDALLVHSFGGPEGPDEVMPFLERVTAGRRVPRERLMVVAEHYHLFGGKSPINAQNRALIAALEAELARQSITLPIYFGNRNAAPFLEDTLARMRDDGVQRALSFVTSAFGSYSGCRQYLDDADRARAKVEGAPELHKLRGFFNHPGYIETVIARTRAAFEALAASQRDDAALVFTAHSIPVSMAQSSPYVAQLAEATRLVAEGVGRNAHDLVYQSRSGPPQVPWLEPDILAHLRALHSRGVKATVLVPIGFISDHMEVVYDLDVEAKTVADELGLRLSRAETAGTHPRFVAMIVELLRERAERSEPRKLGVLGAPPDACAKACCPAPR